MARVRVYSAEQKVVMAARDKAYREANLEKCKARDAAKWQMIKNDPALLEKNRLRSRLAQKKWRDENPEKAKEIDARYKLENPEKRKASVSKWREKNKEKHKSYQKEYQKEHLALFRIHAQNRRSLENGGKLSKNLMDKLMGYQKSKCACCHVDLSTVKIHLDHILPIALGGEHCDSNIQLLCQHCNQHKHAKHPIDFMQSKGMLL